ncbi:hypothetical protein P7C73_g3807, partial [Tremellales sp. Uapishka_1]
MWRSRKSQPTVSPFEAPSPSIHPRSPASSAPGPAFNNNSAGNLDPMNRQSSRETTTSKADKRKSGFLGFGRGKDKEKEKGKEQDKGKEVGAAVHQLKGTPRLRVSAAGIVRPTLTDLELSLIDTAGWGIASSCIFSD